MNIGGGIGSGQNAQTGLHAHFVAGAAATVSVIALEG